MLEILYRIYEVKPDVDPDNPNLENCVGLWSQSKENSIELCMDCYMCETRDDFKNHIRETYGKDIKFAYSKKYLPGTQYCIIIGEHVYNGHKYFNRVEFTCKECGATVKGSIDSRVRIPDWEIKHSLGGDLDTYANIDFCCIKCADHFIEKESQKYKDEFCSNDFIDRDSFNTSKLSGFIYKIAKKSTGEFYIGQTSYVPIFRWGQHLRSDRFPISNIHDYTFEVIETVPLGVNILERENYWIHKYYESAPDKSLNIQNLQKDRRLAEHEKKFKMKIGVTKLDESDTITNT